MKKVFLKVVVPTFLLVVAVLVIGPSCGSPDPNAPIIYKYAIAKVGDTSGAGIKTDGTLWTWGGNNLGTLGNNTMVDSNVPIQIGTDTNWKTLEVGQAHIIALKTDGTLWGWETIFRDNWVLVPPQRRAFEYQLKLVLIPIGKQFRRPTTTL